MKEYIHENTEFKVLLLFCFKKKNMDVKIQKFKTHFRECTFEVIKLVFL